VLEEPHKLQGSMKGWQEWVGQRNEKDTVCISLGVEMMSIYPRVTQIYTHCRGGEGKNPVYWLWSDN